MPRLLLAEDDDAVRNMLRTALERSGFDVVAVASVRDALSCIATENYDVLLSNLHMPHAGDGFTVVSAMRHTHPEAVTLVLSGYPELDEALSAIRSQADEVLVKRSSQSKSRYSEKLSTTNSQTAHRTNRYPRKASPPYWSKGSMLRFRTG